MRKFIINTETGIVKFETAIEYNCSEGETLVETDDISELIFPEVVAEIPQTISPAEFSYGLILQNVTENEVLYFIDNHITDSEVQIKARILFTKATEFEYQNLILNAFIGGFNQFLEASGKEPLNFDNTFINGKKLNE